MHDDDLFAHWETLPKYVKKLIYKLPEVFSSTEEYREHLKKFESKGLTFDMGAILCRST